MTKLLKTGALALAASSMAIAAVPAEARHHDRHGYSQYDRYGDRYGERNAYGEPVYGDTHVWRGNDGRYYCRKKDGTTGLIVGAAAGALLGRAVDGGYNHTTGTLLGGVVGALLGKSVAQSTSCR